MSITLGEFLKQVKPNLLEELSERDAQVLLAHVIGRPRSWLLGHLDAPLTQPQLDSAQQAFARLEAGEPLPYILGHWEFYGLDFNVTPDVLIPRPETELLVEKAIRWLTANPKRRSVADIGTGSGVIAVTIAMHIPDANILATDLSPAALQVAKSNAQKFNVQDRIEFAECDLLPPQSQIVNRKSQMDLLCANLPYIPTQTLSELPIFGREPALALDGGQDGLDLYRRLFSITPKWLTPRGMLLLEIEATQGVQALNLACDAFGDASISLHQDLAHFDRLLEIRRHG